MQSWTIGIICYNEKETICNVFNNVKKLLKTFKTYYEIILVDDASTDGSTQIIQDIATKHPETVRAFYHPVNRGIGAAIRTVYFNGKMENIAFLPGDGQFDASELLPFQNFDRRQYISFYRAENQSYSPFRNIISYLNKLYNRSFLGLDLRDVNWVKVYKRAILTTLELQANSSIIESEICAKLNKLGYQAIQVKSQYIKRVYGESKGASLKNIMAVSKEMFRLFKTVRAFDTPIFETKKTIHQI